MGKSLKSNQATQSAIDQRTYIRLNTIFPVDFAIIHAPEDLLDIYWQQGYTRNVSKGGICLEMIVSDEETLHRLEGGAASFELRIGIPLRGDPLKASAKITWLEKVPGDTVGKYRVGLKFTSISPLDVQRMVNHARWVKFSSYAAVIVSVSLIVLLALSVTYNRKLRLANEELVNRLVATQQEEIKIHAAIEEIIEEGNSVLQQIEEGGHDQDEREELESTYEQINQRKEEVEEQLSALEREKEGLQTTVLEKMHLWLSNSQNPSTGLIASSEGKDAAVKNVAFVYDQALAVNVFLAFKNDKDARQILNFFNARVKEGFPGLYNAYRYDSGDPAEAAIQSGPNIWIGMAALQYLHSTGDKFYLPMARKIADWLIVMQKEESSAGGIKGGPALAWFAIEHNWDAYAFFNMMHKVTEEEKYREAREKVLLWIKNDAMVQGTRPYPTPPVQRGRGDATLATETDAWSLAALGPETLIKIGKDPEAIMEFANKKCAVEVQYRRPSGIKLSVWGFDFSPAVHMPRGGLVSSEWTGQMILSFRILSEYYIQRGDFFKAVYYEEKAKIYLGELNKLIISSLSVKNPGEGCLPYATLDEADTGHGWSTSYGTNTCSVAGTAYMIMALKYWNPLILERGNIKLKVMEGYL